MNLKQAWNISFEFLATAKIIFEMFHNIFVENWHRWWQRHCWWWWWWESRVEKVFVDPKNIDTKNLKTHLLISCVVQFVTQKQIHLVALKVFFFISFDHCMMHENQKSHITYINRLAQLNSTGPYEWVKFSIFSWNAKFLKSHRIYASVNSNY